MSEIYCPRVSSSDIDVKVTEVLEVGKIVPASTSQRRRIFLALCLTKHAVVF